MNSSRKGTISNSGEIYSLSRQEIEYRINRISGYVAIVIELGCILMVALTAMDVFVLDASEMAILPGVLAPFTLSVFYITDIKKVEKPWVKYLVIVSASVVILTLFSMLSMHTVLALAIPIITSCLYFDKKVWKVSLITSVIAILIGHVLSVYLSIVFDDPIVVAMYNSLVYGFLPRILTFVIIAAICYYITSIGTEIMGEGYVQADKARKLLEEQRKTHYEIVKNLATIAENKSLETGDHISRVFKYMYFLAQKADYSDDEAYNIALASMLHDVGKIIVDEKILSKPGKLTDEEFEKMKAHVSYGKYLLSNTNNEVLNLAAQIAEHHHERWDGKGYLIGLESGQVDLCSSMMSVIDVFDALTSVRCYKDAWTKEEALEEIKRGRGTQFNPKVVDLFVENFDGISKIYEEVHAEELINTENEQQATE